MDRSGLDVLRSDDLRQTEIVVARHTESLRFTLIDQLGPGKTAVAWEAVDTRATRFAVKFALRQDYDSHSLEAEIDRVNQLRSPLVARIIFYGVPEFVGIELDAKQFYAIVVEWVEGPTLRSFLNAHDRQIGPDDYRQFARDLCEILNGLRSQELMHSDLHDRNLIVSPSKDALTGEVQNRLIAIDTGQLKTEETRTQLLEQWERKIEILRSVSGSEDITNKIAQLRNWIRYFSRTDQEWVTHHLCSLYNHLRRSPSCQTAQARRFLKQLPDVLRLTIDPDPSRRVDDALEIFRAIESVWKSAGEYQAPGMQTPFDLPSAELIRNDKQLMDLFAEEYPRLDECRSNSPVYIYGPRGCGKSTILRSLSVKAILHSDEPAQELKKVQFTGVYVSCSSELRSRFWLMPSADYDNLTAHIIEYFNLLLVEELVDTLDVMFRWDQTGSTRPELQFGVTEDLAKQCADCIRASIRFTSEEPRHFRASHFSHLRAQIRCYRDTVWRRILRRETPDELPNSQLVFDLTQRIEELLPYFQQRRLAFLLDDYSNQRIPVELQQKLNQSITFAKQGAPIFKVSSEYDGVDLEGIQEGREVREVNVGFEYVSLTGNQRWQFLRSLLERRFAYLENPVDILDILPLSDIQPAISMAKAIRNAIETRGRFYYHGLDTLSDLCSGDFAMGLDIVRRIFEQGGIDWKKPRTVPPHIQHKAIRDFASREFEYIRYRSERGLRKYEIIDRLCWLSHQCVLHKTCQKDGESVPLVKNHIDIAETALQDLSQYSPDRYELLEEMIRKGVLFPLETSKSRESHQGTRRYMVRRILLARYDAPLGRDTPIRIDDMERLRTLLIEPKQFVESELARTNPPSAAERAASAQRRLDFKE